MPRKTLPVYDIGDFRHLGTETDFYANSLPEHLAQNNPYILVPHGHTFYAIIFFTHGSGIHEIDFQDYEIIPGSVFLLTPGQVHTWSFSADIGGYIIFHKKEFFDLNFAHEKLVNFPFYDGVRRVPTLLLKPAEMPATETLFQGMLEEYRNGALMRFPKIASLLNVVYIDFYRWYPSTDPPEGNNLTNRDHLIRLEELIEKHFREIKSPAKYAELMFMSQKNLNRVVKMSLNKTVLEVILDKVTLEAKRMLIYSKSTVSEIALHLGYADTAYFNRLFKRTTGKTPLEFQGEYKSRGINPQVPYQKST